jgi:hypothetical protein
MEVGLITVNKFITEFMWGTAKLVFEITIK